MLGSEWTSSRTLSARSVTRPSRNTNPNTERTVAQYYLINRVQGSESWFPESAKEGDERGPYLILDNVIDAILCATFLVGTNAERTDYLIIGETVIANVETGEQVGKFERS